MIDVNSLPGQRSVGHIFGRLFIYGCLLFCAAIYLMPLVIMISTSLRPLAEIKSGTIIALPREITLDAWAKAWGEACIGTKCTGLSSHFWISLKVVVPSVIVSTAFGVLNGYALTKWRFRGANLVFGLMLFGCFVPFQHTHTHTDGCCCGCQSKDGAAGNTVVSSGGGRSTTPTSTQTQDTGGGDGCRMTPPEVDGHGFCDVNGEHCNSCE